MKTLTSNTMVPIGLVITLFPAFYMIISLSKDVENQAQADIRTNQKIESVISDQKALGIEAMAELKSVNISQSHIDRELAVIKAQNVLILKLLEDKRGGF